MKPAEIPTRYRGNRSDSKSSLASDDRQEVDQNHGETLFS